MRFPLVPAYTGCASPNRIHGPPLDSPACSAPIQSSAQLTVGTHDANGRPPDSSGYVSFDAIVGAPGTPEDEADVAVRMALTDVFDKATLTDYAGELQVRTGLRLVDRANGAGTDRGTVEDIVLPMTAGCTTTPATVSGSNCGLSTTLDAITPGIAAEGARAIWQLGQVEVLDGGPDGDADTPDNAVFARQGLFVP